MNVIINGPQFFLLLDSIFSDLSVNKIRSLNPTYIIKYNDEEIFHYENGVVNVGLDFINKVKSFVPVKIDKEFVINVAKWIRSKTGLKPKTIWIGLKQYQVGSHLNESFNKLRARRVLHIADNYIKDLNPNDVCNYWKSDEVDNYVNESMSEMVRFMVDEYTHVNADNYHETYDGIYEILESINYSNEIRDFFYNSLDNCNINENTTAASAGEYNGPMELGLRKWEKSVLDPFVNPVDSKFNNKSKSKSLKGNEDTVVGMWEKGVDGTYDINTYDVDTVNESEDKPMKKFNRSSNPDKGKYGKLIEDIAYSYFKSPDDVCDLICIKTNKNQTGLGEYILLVLMPHSMSETKLSEHIKSFLPIDVMVLIQASYHCKDED